MVYYYLWRQFSILRLVFTSDGVVVGVVIRSIERYDLVEIKSTDSELSRTLISLMIVAYDQVKTVSGSQAEAEEKHQPQCSIPGLSIGCSSASVSVSDNKVFTR